ncbi:hypothetical protein Q3G72_034424 [Acer saccharum]|nr:hypothetical protein Q3G72_034424 [Acer saccharum]
MAAGAMATAAGAAVLLYYVLSRRLASKETLEDDGGERSGDLSKSNRSAKRRISRRPAQAPATWLETMTTLTETLRFTYSETLGKWPIADLAFGINYLMRREGNLQVASVYAGSDSVQLQGPEIIAELNVLLEFLTLCMLFSKKPFPVFLESAGYTLDDVLIHKPKAALLKPAFTIIRDSNSKCLLLLIRGTHSIKDTLTAATGAVVPFHHSVIHDGGISNLVLGYAHCGMVAAARWIAKLSTPCLLKALGEYPDYKVKIVGHSLGGGTAALLTYILREQKEFSSCTCFTFAPAACMTLDLAESGKHFISTLINGSDLVPTFSAASVDDLRSEVTSSSWINDLRDQVERTRVLNVVYRSATALGSRLPGIASAKARVVGVGALLRPVSSSTQVVMTRAKNVAEAVKTHSSLTSWYCMGPRRRAVGSLSNSKVDDIPEAPLIPERTEAMVTEVVVTRESVQNIEYNSHSSDVSEDDEEQLISVDRGITTSTVEGITEGALWYELEKELKRQENEVDVQAQEEEAAAAKEITEEMNDLADVASESESKVAISSSDVAESHHFYPPGRIMHIVSIPPSSDTASLDHHELPSNERVGIYIQQNPSFKNNDQ